MNEQQQAASALLAACKEALPGLECDLIAMQAAHGETDELARTVRRMRAAVAMAELAGIEPRLPPATDGR